MVDVAFEAGESIVLIVLICCLLVKGKGTALSETKSWRLLLGGFTLILFARLFEIIDQFSFFDHLIVIGQTEISGFLAKGVGSFGGLLVLATGLIQLLPTVQRASAEFAARDRSERMRGRPRTGLNPWVSGGIDRFRMPNVALYECDDGQDWTTQALRHSEERYDLAMEAIRECVYDWDVETGEIYYSPRVKAVLGLSPEELQSVQDWLDRIHPDDAERYNSTLIAHLKGKSERFQCEYRFRGKAGEWRWARHHGIAVRTDTGRAYRMAGSIGDITERKRIEEALRESREMLHAVVNAVPAMISAKDPEFRYAMMNRFQADIYGVSEDDAIGKTAGELLDREYGVYTRGLDRQVFESGEALPYFEEHYPDAKGQPHTWLTTKVPLKNEHGRVRNVVSVALDITERKHADAVLRESEERFKSAFGNAPIGKALIGTDDRYLQVNRALCAIVGYSEGELLGMTWQDLTHPDDLALSLERHEKVWAGKSNTIIFEERYLHKRGHVVWVGLSESLVRDAEGKPLYFITQVQDINERKKTARQLLARARQQAAIAKFGHEALAGADLAKLMDDAVVVVAQALDVEFAKILELLPDGKALLMRAGVGWKEGLVGLATMPADARSQAGYTLVSGDPVTVEDLGAETRFSPSALLRDHDIVSGMSVVIANNHKPFGVLAAHSTKLRAFSRDEVNAFQAVANILAAAIQRRQTEAALAESEERFRNIVANVPGAIFRRVHTPKGTMHYTFISDTYKELFHHDSKRLMANPSALRGVVHPEDFEQFQGAMERSVERLEPQDVEFRIITPEGRAKWVRSVAQPRRAESGDIVCDGIALDITDQKEAEQRIEHLAYHDEKTGLPNRSLFVDRLSQAITATQHNKQNFCVLSLGLDRFSAITATFGHAAGDHILRETAERLKRCLRDSDTVARASADTFLILLARLGQVEDVTKVLRKIRAAFEAPASFEGHDHNLTASIGVAINPGDGKTPEALVRNADIACHQAMIEGPGSDRYYAAGMNDRMFARLSLEQDLRRAVEREEFVLHYQQQVELRYGRVTGVEALVRWQPPNGDLVPPGDFIRLAEETGLIIPLGELVLHDACLQARKWQDSGMPAVSMAVNISGRQLHDGSIVDTVRRILADTGLSPDRLKLELTESSLMDDVEGTVEIMEAFRAMGVRLAVDDFGTGYSSLSYLSRFPIETLKIDRSFVTTMTTDSNNAAIVDAIISLAHGLNMKVIAEGVDATEQLTFLRAYHCDAIQGFIVSPPVPADEIPQMVEQRLAAHQFEFLFL